jgi:hypothetical protein
VFQIARDFGKAVVDHVEPTQYDFAGAFNNMKLVWDPEDDVYQEIEDIVERERVEEELRVKAMRKEDAAQSSAVVADVDGNETAPGGNNENEGPVIDN